MRRLWSLAVLFVALGAGPALAANPQVEIDTTAGTIKLELYPDATPKTVENFLKYVNAGQYNGTQFHRVIRGFMPVAKHTVAIPPSIALTFASSAADVGLPWRP